MAPSIALRLARTIALCVLFTSDVFASGLRERQVCPTSEVTVTTVVTITVEHPCPDICFPIGTTTSTQFVTVAAPCHTCEFLVTEWFTSTVTLTPLPPVCPTPVFPVITTTEITTTDVTTTVDTTIEVTTTTLDTTPTATVTDFITDITTTTEILTEIELVTVTPTYSSISSGTPVVDVTYH
jgi:hypothetical protein